MILYTDSGVSHITQNLEIPHSVTVDIDAFINSQDPVKVAILFDGYNNKLSNTRALVVLNETELPELTNISVDNLYQCLPGVANNPVGCLTFFNGGWLETTANFYKNFKALSDLKDSVDYTSTKPLYFECLLGNNRAHRNFVYNEIVNNNLKDKIFLNYFKHTVTPDNFIFEPGTEINPDTKYSANMVKFKGIDIHLSQIIPATVYNQTAYSIVAETHAKNHSSFFTEKTAKPILARRLFVVFSGQYYLKNLKSLGFLTFDSIIDETYDSVEDDQLRFTLAFDQVKALCQMDQATVLSRVKSIVEHNYNLLMTMSWKTLCDTRITQLINEWNESNK